MLAGVHQLHHKEVGTGSHMAAAHQKEGQLLLNRQTSLVLSINQDIARQLNLEIRGTCIQLTANQGSDTNKN